MNRVSVYVDIDLDDVFQELYDDDLVDELKQRGYNCSKDAIDPENQLTKEELNLLLGHIDINVRPLHWEWQRIRDKLMAMDYKK